MDWSCCLAQLSSRCDWSLTSGTLEEILDMRTNMITHTKGGKRPVYIQVPELSFSFKTNTCTIVKICMAHIEYVGCM